MALIKCLECGKEISDNADACPNCGFPLNQETSESKVVVYGYTQSFLVNPDVEVYINGRYIGIVPVGGILEIPLTQSEELEFKCSFRSAKVFVRAGKTTKIKLTWNRLTGKLLPQIVDNVINDR